MRVIKKCGGRRRLKRKRLGKKLPLTPAVDSLEASVEQQAISTELIETTRQEGPEAASQPHSVHELENVTEVVILNAIDTATDGSVSAHEETDSYDIVDPLSADQDQNTSDETLIEISVCMDETLVSSNQVEEAVKDNQEERPSMCSSPVERMKTDGDKPVTATEDDSFCDDAFSGDETSDDCNLTMSEISELPTIQDSLAPDSDDERISKKSALQQNRLTVKVYKEPEPEPEPEPLEDVKDLLADEVGQFVEVDSSPENFYQSEQVTEALELLRDIHEEEEVNNSIVQQQVPPIVEEIADPLAVVSITNTKTREPTKNICVLNLCRLKLL